MTFATLKKSVQKQIENAQTGRAIDQILIWARNHQHRDLETDAIQFSARWKGLRREIIQGTISQTNASISTNRINNGLLELLSSYSDLQPTEETPMPESRTEMMKVLMLSANPATRTILHLEKEHSTINEKLQEQRDRFQFIWKKAVSGSEFKEHTQQIQPNILHFSGHGQEGRYAGIVVQNDSKNGEELLSADGLRTLFKFFKKRFGINVVLLNACHSQEQASVIAEYVSYVIGTSAAIGDESACAFSRGFYFQIAEDDPIDIENAFDSGRTEAAMKGAQEAHFVLYKNGKRVEIE